MKSQTDPLVALPATVHLSSRADTAVARDSLLLLLALLKATASNKEVMVSSQEVTASNSKATPLSNSKEAMVSSSPVIHHSNSRAVMELLLLLATS
jgi:hypothetical protein